MRSSSFKTGIVVLLVGLVLFANAEVRGEDWKYYAEDAEGKFFYDMNSVTRPSRDIMRVRQKLVYSEKGVSELVVIMDNKEFNNLLERVSYYEFDCENKKSRVLSYTFFTRDGKILMSGDSPTPYGHFINPHFTGENELYKILCK